jgi:hypothetical protein
MGRECSMHSKDELHKQFRLQNVKETDHRKDIDVNGNIRILKWFRKKYDRRTWNGFLWLRIQSSKYSREPSGSIK